MPLGLSVLPMDCGCLQGNRAARDDDDEAPSIRHDAGDSLGTKHTAPLLQVSAGAQDADMEKSAAPTNVEATDVQLPSSDDVASAAAIAATPGSPAAAAGAPNAEATSPAALAKTEGAHTEAAHPADPATPEGVATKPVDEAARPNKAEAEVAGAKTDLAGEANKFDFFYPVQFGGSTINIAWNLGEDAEKVADRFLSENGVDEEHRSDTLAFIAQAMSLVGNDDTSAGGGDKTQSSESKAKAKSKGKAKAKAKPKVERTMMHAGLKKDTRKKKPLMPEEEFTPDGIKMSKKEQEELWKLQNTKRGDKDSDDDSLGSFGKFMPNQPKKDCTVM